MLTSRNIKGGICYSKQFGDRNPAYAVIFKKFPWITMTRKPGKHFAWYTKPLNAPEMELVTIEVTSELLAHTPSSDTKCAA